MRRRLIKYRDAYADWYQKNWISRNVAKPWIALRRDLRFIIGAIKRRRRLAVATEYLGRRRQSLKPMLFIRMLQAN